MNTVRHSWLGALAGVLMLFTFPACSTATGLDEAVADFAPLRPAPGLTVTFDRDYGSVTVTHPEEAQFEFRSGWLYMSDGTSEAPIYPVRPAHPKARSLETYERLIERHGVIPRMEELLAQPEQIAPILSRYPVVPPVVDYLPADLDPNNGWVRAAAYEAYLAERKDETFWAASQAFVHSGGNVGAQTAAAVAVLESSPLVLPGSVEVEPTSLDDDQHRVIWFRFVGGFLDPDGQPHRWPLALPDDYDRYERWIEGRALIEPEPVEKDEALAVYNNLASAIKSGKRGTIDLSTGLTMRLEGVLR